MTLGTLKLRSSESFVLLKSELVNIFFQLPNHFVALF